MAALEDLVGLFGLISGYQPGKNNLVLDPDISNKLNFLTDNKFSKFSNDSNIDRIFWLDGELNNQLDILLNDQDTGNNGNVKLSLVFLLDLSTEENFSKLVKFENFIRNYLLIDNKDKYFNLHLIISHPSFNKSIDNYLSNKGILGNLTSFNLWNTLNYFDLNDDIYSLELNYDAGFNQLFYDNSPLPIELLAKSLLSLYIKSNYKLRITNIYLKGEKSSIFWKIFNRLLKSHLQQLDDSKLKNLNDIDETIFMNSHSFYNNSVDLICFDRSVDLISLLLSQLSYSGLINELLLKQKSQLNLIQFNNINDSNDPIKMNLNDSDDIIYPNIKYLNFSHVGPILNKNAKLLQSDFDKRKNLNNIQEMKNFVNELNNLKNVQKFVQNHTNLAQFIINNLENDSVSSKSNIPLLDNLLDENLDSYFSQLIELQQDIISDNLSTNQIFSKISNTIMLNDNSNLNDVIKLLILTSICKKGLNNLDFLNLKNDLVNKFGFNNVIPLVLKLQQLKIIQINPNQQLSSFLSKSNNNFESSQSQYIQNFTSIKNSLNLLPLHDNSENLTGDDITNIYTDPDFGYPGYVPIITRLIQSIYDRSYLEVQTNVSNDSPNSNNNNKNIGISRAIKYGWNNLDLSGLNGDTVQEFLVPDEKKKMFSSIVPPKISDLNKNIIPDHQSTIIICAIGGLTWSEIATIKYTVKSNNFTKNKRLIILTTGIITGNNILDTLSHLK